MAGGEFGGAEAFFARLAPALHRAGADQLCVTRPNARNRALADAGVPLLELPFASPYLDPVTRFRLAVARNRFRPDIVLAWMNRASAFAPAGNAVKLGRLGGYYKLKHYADCHHLIGNTRDIVDYLVRQGWPAERAHYVPNFVNADKAAPAERAGFATPDGVPVILCLGRLHVNKGYDVAIRALARVPDAHLWLAGEGGLRRRLHALAESEGVAARVRFLGWRRDVPALFAAADILCCPSRHEPLGNVVIEAWAQGKPVVAARAEGPGTLITHGRSGLLSEVEDRDGLAENLNRIIKAPALQQTLVAGGRAVYERDFTEAVVVARFQALFEEVLR